MIVGAPYLDRGGLDYAAGAAYVIFGKADGFGPIDLKTLAPEDGFVLLGAERYDTLGNSVAAAGDVNGDGVDDLLVGAALGDVHGNASGKAYVIYGMLPTEDVVRIGSEIGQTIRGGTGNDRLEGRGGDDALIGGGGGDALFGQDGDDDLNGGEGDDKVRGGGGNDITHGGAGTDRLSGDGGDDALYGGEGKDLLSGGAGADRFHFSLGGTAPDAKNADRITDFSQAEHDLIDLSDYDADPGTPGDQPFHFVGTAAFSGAIGEVRYEFAAGDTLVSGDSDGDQVADFTVRLTGDVALMGGDFLLVAAGPPVGGHTLLGLLEHGVNPLLHLA